MSALTNLRDELQTFRIEEHYEPNDMLEVLNFIERLISIAETQEKEICRLSNELGQHLNE